MDAPSFSSSPSAQQQVHAGDTVRSPGLLLFTGFRTTKFHSCPSESPMLSGLCSHFAWLITLQNVARTSGASQKTWSIALQNVVHASVDSSENVVQKSAPMTH
jgi:hypothetical protein